MTLHRRSPRPLAQALGAARAGWEPRSELGRAQSAWTDLASAWRDVLGEHGSYILERTTLVGIRAGVLTVGCEEAVVADALALESERIIERLTERLGSASVSRLRCVVKSSDKSPKFG
jgi:hypothetical protein